MGILVDFEHVNNIVISASASGLGDPPPVQKVTALEIHFESLKKSSTIGNQRKIDQCTEIKMQRPSRIDAG